MTLVSTIEARGIFGVDGAPLGVIERLLFHPSEPRVIGAMVRPPAVFKVVERPATFLPLSSLSFGDARTVAGLVKLPKRRKGAEGLGFDPDLTVMWTGMPVRGPSGRDVGAVSDVEFDASSGLVSKMEIAAGVVADAAHGRYVVQGADVIGYADGAVRIGVEAPALDSSGGLAKAAAGTYVVVSSTAAAIGESVGDAVVGASGATGRAIRVVADSKAATAATKRIRSTWRDTRKAFREGMNDGK